MTDKPCIPKNYLEYYDPPQAYYIPRTMLRDDTTDLSSEFMRKILEPRYWSPTPAVRVWMASYNLDGSVRWELK